MKRLSRSKLDLFFECRRCLWLSERKQVARPSGYPLTINLVIDALLKRELDGYRAAKKPHPLMPEGFVAFDDARLGVWRNNFNGVSFFIPEAGFELYGAIDDVWLHPDKGLIYVVDYKATGAKTPTIYPHYQRQVEIYAWLLARNGLRMADEAFWLFAACSREGPPFSGAEPKLSFTLSLKSAKLDTSWVLAAAIEMGNVLRSNELPPSGAACEYCRYALARGEAGRSIRAALSSTLPPPDVDR